MLEFIAWIKSNKNKQELESLYNLLITSKTTNQFDLTKYVLWVKN